MAHKKDSSDSSRNGRDSQHSALALDLEWSTAKADQIIIKSAWYFHITPGVNVGHLKAKDDSTSFCDGVVEFRVLSTSLTSLLPEGISFRRRTCSSFKGSFGRISWYSYVCIFVIWC